MAAASVGQPRFDRSSWITLSIILVLAAASLGVVAAAYALPGDGWYIDRGAWGRYRAPIFIDPVIPANLEALHRGDVLLAVDGVPFEQLEAQAASLRPQRPPNWQLGATVHYTVLRQGEAVIVPITLVRTPLFANYHPIILLTDPLLLTFPLFFVAGLLAFALRPRERAAQLLVLYCTAFFIDNFVSALAVEPSVADLFTVGTYWPRLILGNMLWTYFIAPVLIHLFLIFPARKALLQRFPRLVLVAVYGFHGAASLSFVAWNITGHYASGVTFVSLVNMPGLIFAPISLIHSWLTAAEPVARLQARWVAFGLIVGIAGPVVLWISAGGLTARTPLWQQILFLLLSLALPVCLAIAILRYRLWDIEIIIRRTLVYSVLSGALALVYLVSVVTLQSLLRVMPGQPQSPAVTALSTLAAATLFFPLRGRVQRLIDRRFYRRKYDAARTLAAFGLTLRDQTDLEHLARQLLGVVDETMQPVHLSLWLQPNSPRPELNRNFRRLKLEPSSPPTHERS